MEISHVTHCNSVTNLHLAEHCEWNITQLIKSNFPIAITTHVPSAILSSSCRTIQADIFIKTQRRDNSILQNYNVAFSENIVILYKHFTRGIAITIITTPIITLYTILYWPTCHLICKIVIILYYQDKISSLSLLNYIKMLWKNCTFYWSYTIPTVTIMPY